MGGVGEGKEVGEGVEKSVGGGVGERVLEWE